MVEEEKAGSDALHDVELGQVPVRRHVSAESTVSEREEEQLSMKEEAPPKVRLDCDKIVFEVDVPPPPAEEAKGDAKGGGDKAAPAPTKKRILHGVSASVRPGEVMAIIGPSGAGKSSLLNILAGQVTPSSGEVLLNGQARTKMMKRYSAYVAQDDTFFSQLTVYDTLRFSALLRLPSATLTREQKLRRVRRIIRMLGLGKAERTKVGSAFEPGISGGERRRLSIGVELITNPSLLLLDEPTSGLDSATALAVVDTLADMAHTGSRAVMMTVHQPSSVMFSRFDTVLLLAEGRTIYFGPAKEVAAHFERQQHPCPLHYNIAEWCLELVSDRSLPGNVNDRVVMLADAFAEIEAAGGSGGGGGGGAALAVLDEPAVEVLDDNGADDAAAAEVRPSPEPASSSRELGAAADTSSRRWATSWHEQFLILCERTLLVSSGTRLKGIFAFQYLATAFAIGTLWFQMEEEENEIDNRLGMMFFVTVFLQFSGLFAALTVFPAERPVLTKERAAGSYRLSSYFLARNLAELPAELAYPTCLVVLSYVMGGLNPNFGRFLLTLLAQVGGYMAASSVGLFISIVQTNFQHSLIYSGTALLAWMLFGGFYAESESIPVWVRWFQYTSPTFYGFNLVSQIQLRGQTYSCGSPSAYVGCATGTSISGETILARNDLDVLPPGVNVLLLIGFFGFFLRYLSYVALRRSKGKSGGGAVW